MNYFIPDYERDFFDWLVNYRVIERRGNLYLYVENKETGELGLSQLKKDNLIFIIKPKKY